MVLLYQRLLVVNVAGSITKKYEKISVEISRAEVGFLPVATLRSCSLVQITQIVLVPLLLEEDRTFRCHWTRDRKFESNGYDDNEETTTESFRVTVAYESY